MTSCLSWIFFQILFLLSLLGFFRVKSKFFSRFCNIFPGFCQKTSCFSRSGPVFPGFPGAVGTLKQFAFRFLQKHQSSAYQAFAISSAGIWRKKTQNQRKPMGTKCSPRKFDRCWDNLNLRAKPNCFSTRGTNRCNRRHSPVSQHAREALFLLNTFSVQLLFHKYAECQSSSADSKTGIRSPNVLFCLKSQSTPFSRTFRTHFADTQAIRQCLSSSTSNLVSQFFHCVRNLLHRKQRPYPP